MNKLGYIFLGLGFAFILGAGIPPYGFSQLPDLLAEYKKARLEKRKPSLNQLGAYYCDKAYRVGGCLIIIGGLILLIIVFIGE